LSQVFYKTKCITLIPYSRESARLCSVISRCMIFYLYIISHCFIWKIINLLSKYLSQISTFNMLGSFSKMFLTLLLVCSFSLIYANESIEDLRSRLIQDSKVYYERNDEVAISIQKLIYNYSPDTVQLILDKIPEDKYTAFALSYMAFHIKHINTQLANQYIASAMRIAKQYDEPKLWYWVYRHQGFVNKINSKYEEALENFERSNEYAATLKNYERGRIINLIHFAECYQFLQNFEKSFEYAYLNLQAREALPLEFGSAYAYQYLGELFSAIHDFPEAFKVYSKAQEIYKKVGSKSYEAYMINVKSITLIHLNLLDSALVLANQAKLSFLEIGDDHFLSRINQHIGSIHFKKEEYSKALDYYTVSESLIKKNKNLSLDYGIDQNIGAVYLALKEYELAEKYYVNFLHLLNGSNDKYQLSIAHANLAQLALKKEDYKKAIKEATLSLNLSKEQKHKNLQINSLKDLYQANFQLKKYDKANEIQEEISDLNKIIKQDLQTKNASNLRLKYELRNQRDQLKKENIRSLKEKQTNKKIAIILALGAGIISLLSFYIIRITRKRNKSLSDKNEEIALLNEKLESKVIERTAALKEQTETLNNYFDNSPGVAYRFLCNYDFTPVFISKGCYDLFGVTPEYVIHSQTSRNLIHPDYHHEIIKQTNDFVKRNDFNEILELVHPIKVEKGSKWVMNRSKLLLNKDGKTYLDGIFLDITDQMIAEAALKINREELSLIYNNTQDFMGLIKADENNQLTLESINQPYLNFLTQKNFIKKDRNITGISLEEYFSDILQMPKEGMESRFEFLNNLRQTKEPINYETKIPLAGDNPNVFNITLTPIVEKGNDVCSRIIFVLNDITQRKKAENQLHKSKQEIQNQLNFNQKILSSTQDGYILMDSDAKIINVNNTYCTMSGYSKEELTGMCLSDLDQFFSKESIQKTLQKVIKDGSGRFEVKHIKKDKSVMALDVNIGAIQIDNKTMITAFYRDITAQRKARKALKISEKRLSTIYNSSQDFIGLVNLNQDNEMIVESINQPSVNLFKKFGLVSQASDIIDQRAEWLFKEIYGLNPEEIEYRMNSLRKVFKEKVTFKYENQFSPNTTDLNLYFETIISPIVDDNGNCTQALYVNRDITARKTAIDKVIASEKQLSMVFNGSKDILFIFDVQKDGTFTFVEANETFKKGLALLNPELNIEDIYGLNADVFLKNFMGQSEELANEKINFALQAIKQKKPIEYPEVHTSADQKIKRLYEVTVTPIFNKDGTCKKLFYASKNITQKIITQQALAESEKRLSTIYNSSQDVIGLIKLTADKDYEIESINEPSIQLFNKIGLPYTMKDFEGMKMKMLFKDIFNLSPALISERIKILDSVFSTNKTVKYTSPFLPKGSDISMSFETVISPILDLHGNCTHALYSARDITESEVAKNKLISSQKRLASIFNGAHDQMAIFDVQSNGDIIFEDSNNSFAKGWKVTKIDIPLESTYGKDFQFFLKKIIRSSEKEILNKEDVCTKLLFILRDVTEKQKAKERMISKILETEDRERSRFAKELHDSLGQNLTVASLNFNFVKKHINDLNTDTQQKFEAGFSFLKEAIQESRNIAHNLMPQAIADFGYILAIESLIESLSQSTNIEFTFYDNLKGNRLSEDHELSLYRITQEAINNILKHAEATIVNIQLIRHIDSVILTIEDNGKGFQTQTHKINSFGLNSMKNRASALSGVLDIEGTPGRGTSITLEIPI